MFRWSSREYDAPQRHPSLRSEPAECQSGSVRESEWRSRGERGLVKCRRKSISRFSVIFSRALL